MIFLYTTASEYFHCNNCIDDSRIKKNHSEKIIILID
jgi:hypothetical protein